MDAVYIHHVAAHYPIVGTTIAIGILLYGYFFKKREAIKIAMFVFVFIAIFSIPVYFSGERIEDKFMNYGDSIFKNINREHKELAKKAQLLMGLLGILSLVNLYLIIKNRAYVRIISLVILLVSLGTFDVFLKVGELGLQMKHTELRDIEKSYQAEKNTLRTHLNLLELAKR